MISCNVIMSVIINARLYLCDTTSYIVYVSSFSW